MIRQQSTAPVASPKLNGEIAGLSNRLSPPEIRSSLTNPTFNLSAMTNLLDHDNQEMRSQFRLISITVIGGPPSLSELTPYQII